MQVERISYQNEWLDNVILKAKFVMEQLAKETFNRYREIGKIIGESGYKKGQWNDKHKQKFLDDLGISRPTFTRMVQLGAMEEPEFVRVTNQFSSFNEWTHQGSIAKKAKREREIQVIREAIKHIEPPQQKYDVIVVDPPWNYGTDYDPDTRRGACPYPEMTLEEIRNVKLPMAENCVLWLWTTNAFMEDAFKILRTWGFEPKTILTWAKNKFGVGYWLRGQTEHCILAIKGTPIYDQEKAANYSTLLKADVGEHSEKPQEFYDLVDAVCVGWKYDYFARKKREGWSVHGTLEDEL